MIREGQVVLFRFPQTDHVDRELRPAVVLRRSPGRYDDWLVCMISTQLHQEIPGTDVVISDGEPDFPSTGLKSTSLIRVTRLAVVAGGTLEGAIGEVGSERLKTICVRISQWILGCSRTAED